MPIANYIKDLFIEKDFIAELCLLEPHKLLVILIKQFQENNIEIFEII